MLKFAKNNIHALAILFISGLGIFLIAFFLFIWMVSIGVFGPVPGYNELSSIHQQQASRILSADSVQLGTYHHQNRTVVSLEDINPSVTDALIAIEDIRFYNHSGVDYRALGRVFVRTILLRQNAGGGSTITQQLAKNLYPRENGGGLSIATDKFREMIIARRLENIYSKDEILELYLNTVSFGEDTFGIEMASKRFFNKTPDRLNTTEAATLVGVLKATTYYNPNRNPDRALSRRNLVISQMNKYEMLPDSLASEFSDEPLNLNYTRDGLSAGSAPYFREHLRKELLAILQTRPALDGNSYDLFTDGLTIHTTIHSEVQAAAENAVNSHLKELQKILDGELEQNPVFKKNDPDILRVWQQSEDYKELIAEGFTDEEIEEVLHTPTNTRLFTWDGYQGKNISPYDEIRHYLSFLNAGFIAMNPQNGNILAWVGGINYGHFQYDQITAKRQPGSAFKPILYASALENGRTPCDYQRNVYATYTDYDDWTPGNVDNEYGGRYSLQAALATSINTIAVQVARETGLPNIRETASALGIQSSLPNAPSIALGTSELSLLELTTAYTAFLNEGKPANPSYISHITNAEGEIIYNFNLPDITPSGLAGSSENENGISSETAAAMVLMLEKAVNEGTGTPLRNLYGIQTAIGGKTGTTQNYSDGWFMGFTPEIVFGTRVGGFNQRIRFRDYPGYASLTALPVAGIFLSEISNNEVINVHADQFYDYQTESSFDFSCSDYRDDRVRDRLRDFFTGRDSDEPREISNDDDEKSGNIFKRLGRRLGIGGSDSDNDNGKN